MSFITLGRNAVDVRISSASTSKCVQAQDRSVGSVRTIVAGGRFEVDFQLSTAQRIILENVAPTYTDEMIHSIFRPIIEQREGWCSIRVIEWLLTNFSKARRVVVRQLDGRQLNVFSEYRRTISYFKRRDFDAFRRRLRVIVHTSAGEELVSTVAQLNFFAWAWKSGILTWIRNTENAKVVEEHMLKTSARRVHSSSGRRRSALSQPTKCKVAIYEDSADDARLERDARCEGATSASGARSVS